MPDDLGYTEAEVQALLVKAGLLWDAFLTWMDGQTVGGAPDGTLRFYRTDVERYVRSKGRAAVVD